MVGGVARGGAVVAELDGGCLWLRKKKRERHWGKGGEGCMNALGFCVPWLKLFKSIRACTVRVCVDWREE